MPKTEGSVVISTKPTGNPERFPFHQHQFVGANTYMLEIIKNNRIKLGAIGDEASFDARITDTKEFLKAAADVSIATPVLESNGTLHFSVEVTNHSGHKFPTSLPVRRAWLHVKVIDLDTNQTVFESGALNSAGQIIGVDDTAGYEPHFEMINNNGSVQVYEPVMADTDGQQTYTFMHAYQLLKDNRILPSGFKNNAPSTVQPYGLARDDADYVSGGSDTLTYVVEGLDGDDYSVTATLNYQIPSYGFMQDLYSDDDLMDVALMKALDANATNRFEMISTDTQPTAP